MKPCIHRISVLPALVALLLAGCGDVGLVQIPLWDLEEDEEQATVSEVVIGQPDASSGTERTENPAANTLNAPRGNMLWHDSQLFIPDTLNHRVLIFNGIPNTPDPEANAVLGQPDLDSGAPDSPQADNLFRPRTVAASNDNVFVIADTENHRVLIWDEPPQSQSDTPDTVLGQPDFQSAVDACTGGDTMRDPTSVWLDGDRLIVADSGNHRVLIWDGIPDTNGAAADLVLGQEDAVNCFSNRGGAVEADTLSNPTDIWSDGTVLLVADSGNHRVLIWDTLPNTTGSAADTVIGQADMQSGLANGPDGLTSDSELNNPRYLAVSDTRIFIADSNNARIVILYELPDSNGASFDSVMGQPDFETGTVRPVEAGNFSNPSGLLWTGNRLLVADQGFYRVQIFQNFQDPPDDD